MTSHPHSNSQSWVPTLVYDLCPHAESWLDLAMDAARHHHPVLALRAYVRAHADHAGLLRQWLPPAAQRRLRQDTLRARDQALAEAITATFGIGGIAAERVTQAMARFDAAHADVLRPPEGPSMPTTTGLARWISDHDIPEEALAESVELLHTLFQASCGWFISEDLNLKVWVSNGQDGALKSVSDVINTWANIPGSARPRLPLAPLVQAWFASQPRQAKTNTRKTGRIIPAKLAMAPETDRRAGRLFSHAAHIPAGDQKVLPGFDYDLHAPALPLALYDLGAGQHLNRRGNPGAPLALRLWISSILAVRQQDRRGDQPVALNISLRQLLQWLYPAPLDPARKRRIPRPSEYWSRLMSVVELLDRNEARLPWYDPETGRTGLRRVVSVGDIPWGQGALEDYVRIIVDLPPGSEAGPQVSDRLEKWGLVSDRAYRALLNLAYWWHDPGVTIRPVGNRADGRGPFWAQTADPSYYPIMSDDQLVQIVFPTAARARRRDLARDAHATLQMLKDHGELRIVHDKVLPPLKARSQQQG